MENVHDSMFLSTSIEENVSSTGNPSWFKYSSVINIMKECDLDEAECWAGHLPAGAGEQEQHIPHNHLSQILDNTGILKGQ